MGGWFLTFAFQSELLSESLNKTFGWINENLNSVDSKIRGTSSSSFLDD